MNYRLLALIKVAENNDLDGIKIIPAMQRRRLSALAKLALHTARTLVQQVGQVDYIVWSSCYGDERTTLNIMQDIAQQQTPSPTQFSVSVHNAISGLYSILFQDDTPATSLSSMPHHSWQDAILEAYSYLRIHGQKRALIVYYDAPLPELYQVHHAAHQQQNSEPMFAIGAVISLDAEQELPNLTMQFQGMSQPSNEPQAKAFYDFWHSEQQVWHSQSWLFEKCNSFKH